MKKIRTIIFILVLICFVSTSGLWAQTDTSDGLFFDMSEFPQWARDLRRGSIITFGVFPFAYLFATFGFNMYRYATRGWDIRYAPWPIGSPRLNEGELFMTIGLAAGTAITFALVDYTIVRFRRSRLEREIRRIPEGVPVIIRRPLHEDEAGVPEGDASSQNGPEAGSGLNSPENDTP